MALTPKRVILLLLLSLLAAGLVVIIMAALGEYTKTRGRLLLTALSLSGFSLLALTPSLLAQRANHQHWGHGGLGIAGLAYLLLVGGLWGTPDSDAYWKSVAIASLGSASFCQVCWLLLMTPPRPLIASTAWITACAASSLVLALAAIAIIVEIRSAPFWWAVGILIIVHVSGGIAAPILNRWPSHR
ncbi:MAG: hypothetical protein BZY75_06150 [SAR202 cluster bacterium Io17-Chloro-G7]|nr:MAG: hypothetical protein BZY75_06150 [SAR202 cluster bacterium Io17-Chloro-G7]